MIDAKQQVHSCVVLRDLKRIEGGFIGEAHSIWDKLEGELCPYPDFMKLYVTLKWANWYNEVVRN